MLKDLQPVSKEAIGHRLKTLVGRRLELQIGQLKNLVSEASKKHGEYATYENNPLVGKVFVSCYKVPGTRVFMEIWSIGDPKKNDAKELHLTFVEATDSQKNPKSLSLITTGYEARVRGDKATDLADFMPKQLFGIANLIRNAVNVPPEVFERIAHR